jgi:hypothetical protein
MILIHQPIPPSSPDDKNSLFDENASFGSAESTHDSAAVGLTGV